MSDANPEFQDNSELPNNSEILPPVEPPSAKFIVQLFVVPGVIVAMIVGVWLLFGKLASAEQNWQALLEDMKSSNEHRRGRGAMGLAQALAADQNQRGVVTGPKLSTNPQVAAKLSEFLAEKLSSSSPEPAVIDQQSFLTRTLGMLDVPEAVLPTLRDAMNAKHDREVRKNAVLAVATIAHRANERSEPLTDAATVEELSNVSREADPLLRSSAAFALGLLPAEATKQPLTVLLTDSDGNTRLNAAIAFARQKSLDGLPVLRDVLKEAGTGKHPVPPQPDEANTGAGLDSVLAVANSLRAVAELSPQLDDATRDELARDIEAVSKNYHEPRVRLDAAQTLTKIRGR
jgi:HEAT repeat protein